MATISSSPLLRLPPELLTKIVSYCICHYIPTKVSVSARGSNYTPSHLLGSNSLYGESSNCNLPYPLTQVCRQIRHEALRRFFSAHSLELGLWRENRWQPAEEWLKGILSLPYPPEEDVTLSNVTDWKVTVAIGSWPEDYFRFRIFAPWEVADEQVAAQLKERTINEMFWTGISPPAGSRRRKVARVGERHVLLYETAKDEFKSADQTHEFLTDKLSIDNCARGTSGDGGMQGLGAQDILDLIDSLVTRPESAEEVLEEGALDIFG